MSASERRAAQIRAESNGRAAALAGQSRGDNPYKRLGSPRHPGGSRHGEGSLYPAWDIGFSKGLAERNPPL